MFLRGPAADEAGHRGELAVETLERSCSIHEVLLERVETILSGLEAEQRDVGELAGCRVFAGRFAELG